jgi:hypothetical protein
VTRNGPGPETNPTGGPTLPEVLADLVGRDVLDRIRDAIAAIEARGEKPTGRAVRELARIDANKVDRVLRAYKAGQLPPLTETWERKAKKPPAMSELEQEINAADTVGKLEQANKHVMGAIMRGDLEPRVGDLVLRGVKEQRALLKMRMLELQAASVASIEVLTPGELAALEAYRAGLRPKAVKPGEEVPPP